MIVFVNYTGDDHARQLIKDLQNSGVDITVNPNDQSDATLIVLTPASVGLTNWQGQTDRPVIPVCWRRAMYRLRCGDRCST